MDNVKSRKITQVDEERVKKEQIKRLEWYRYKGWSKEELIELKIFPREFIDKYYEDLNYSLKKEQIDSLENDYLKYSTGLLNHLPENRKKVEEVSESTKKE